MRYGFMATVVLIGMGLAGCREGIGPSVTLPDSYFQDSITPAPATEPTAGPNGEDIEADETGVGDAVAPDDAAVAANTPLPPPPAPPAEFPAVAPAPTDAIAPPGGTWTIGKPIKEIAMPLPPRPLELTPIRSYQAEQNDPAPSEPELVASRKTDIEMPLNP